MKTFKLFLIMMLFVVVSCNKDLSDQKNTDYKKYIGKKYSSLNDLEPSISEGSSRALENNYSMSIYGKKPWNPDDGRLENVLVFLEILVGYSGNLPIHQVTDVLYVDLKKYKANSEVRLEECTLAGNQEYSSVAVYQLEEASKTENGLKPERAWHPDIKTGKFVEVSPDNLLCQTEEGESD